MFKYVCYETDANMCDEGKRMGAPGGICWEVSIVEHKI